MNINEAIIRLHKSWNFIGVLLARIQFIEDASGDCPTAETDGYRFIKVNPEFINGLTKDDVTIVLCHEVLHIVLRNTYGPMSTPQYPRVWNVAEDMVVNSILDEHYIAGKSIGNISIHKRLIWPVNNTATFGGITITDITDKTVSQIYWELLSKIKSNPQGKDGDGDCDGVPGYISMDSHDKLGSGDMSSSEIEKVSGKWKRDIVQASMSEAAKSKGSLPGCLSNLIESITEAKIPWRERLRNMMVGTIISDSSYSKFNKRNYAVGVVMPGYLKDGLDVIVHLDTSGSTSDLLAEFLSEIKGIAEVVPGSEVTVIQCDSEIQRIDSITSDFSSFEAEGFGGTSHRPVIDYINDMPTKPKMFISFTDGYSDIEQCYDDLEGNIYKVICLPEQYSSMAESLSPYGEILVID